MASALTSISTSLWGMEYSVHSELQSFNCCMPYGQQGWLPAAVVCCRSAPHLIALSSIYNLALLLLLPPHPHAGLPASMSREVQSVFPDVDLAGMLVVPTCQQADYDLVRTGEKVEGEKDRLLERVRAVLLLPGAAAVAQGVDTWRPSPPLLVAECAERQSSRLSAGCVVGLVFFCC